MGFGDFLAKVGRTIEAGSDVIGVDKIGHAIDSGLEATGELADDLGLDNAYDPVTRQVIKPALHGLEKAYNFGARAYVTAQINEDWTGNWGESWRQAKDISPGQAFVAALGKKSAEAGDTVGVSGRDVLSGVPIAGSYLQGLVGGAAEDDFDVTDEAQRKEVFETGMSGPSMLSGSIDATLRWFADPLVIGGKAAHLAKVKAVDQPVGLNKLDDAGREARLDEVVGSQFTGEVDAGKRMQAIAQHYFPEEKLSRGARLRMFVEDPNFKHNIGAAEFLAHAETPHELMLRMRVAMNPSIENKTFLDKFYVQASEEFDRLQDTTIGLESAMDDITMDLATAMELGDDALIAEVRAETMKQGRRLDIARRELERASGEAGQILLARNAAGTVKNVPRVRTSQKLKEAGVGRSKREGDLVDDLTHVGGKAEPTGVTWATYQPSRFSAVRVLRSAASTRAGVIVHDQPNSAVEQITRFFDRVGHGGKIRGNVGISHAVREQHILAVSNAAYSGSIPDLQKAIQAAEEAGIQHIAKQQGITPEVASALYADLRARRTTALETLTSVRRRKAEADLPLDAAGQPLEKARPEGTFSGATRDGHRADEYVMADGTTVVAPGAVSMLENSTPLIDLDIITRLLRRERYTLTDPDTATLLQRIGDKTLGMNGKGAQAADITRWSLEQFNRAWKPAQLFRLGWPVRVVTDENLRSMAAIGALAHMKVSWGESLGNSLAQGRMNYRVRDLATAAQRRHAKAKLAGGADERAGKGEERLGLVEELVAAQTDQAELATQIEKVRGVVVRAQDNAARKAEEARAALAAREGADADLPPLRILITGSRDWPNEAAVRGALQRALDSVPPGREVRIVHGTAAGADTHAANFARDTANRSVEEAHPADWNRHGRRAGFVRNQEMVDSGADMVLAFINNNSRGATHAAAQAERAGIPVRRYQINDGIPAPVADEPFPWMAQVEASRAEAKKLQAKVANIEGKASATEARSIARLDTLRAQQLENAALLAERTGKRDALTKWFNDVEEDHAKYLSRSKRPSDRIRGEDGRPLKFTGNITLTKNGISIERPDAFAGAYGRLFMDLTSASSTTRALANTSVLELNQMRVVGGDTVTLTGVLPEAGKATKQEITLLRETYNTGWERAVNDQIGNDVMLRQIAQGRTDDEILTWMRETTAGVEYTRKMASVPRSQKEEWVANARAHVEQYLPDENLKLLALNGQAKAKHLRDWNKTTGRDEADLPIIHAQSLDLITGVNALDHGFSNVVDKLYAKIGTAPTDVLSRQPFFASIYRREMQNSFEGLNAKAGDEISEEIWEAMERDARQTALREVKRTMYDVANASNLAHTMRFVMPFYAAWQDALGTWARIWTNDPSTLAHLTQVWEAPQKTNLVYENADGEKYMAIPLPKAVREKLGLSENPGMPVNWMRDLIFTGEYWYNPGVGVPVTVPLAAAVRDRPSLEKMFEPIMPYGAGDNAWDQILPSGWKKGQSLFNEEDDADYAKAQFRLFQDVYTEDRLNDTEMTDIEMWDEAKRRTNALFTVRMAANFGLPFAPNIRSPYQLYIDQWRIMQEKYRQDPNAFGGKSAQDAYIDEWGEDYFIFTLASTKSNVGGIAPTVEGFKAFEEYRDLVREMPEMGSLIVGDTSGEYSATTAQWMLEENIGGGDTTKLRDIRDPKQGLIDAEVNQGWTRFRAIADATDAALAERGLTSLRSNAAADIKQTRDILIERIKKDYPHWGEEFGNFDRTKADRRVGFMEKLVDDPRVIERPGFRSLAQYLAARQLVVEELKLRPSQNLQAQDNADLRTTFEIITNRLRQADTEFATLHTRWLSSDDLDTGGEA